MRALFYDPYLDTLGGGERYTLSLVEALAAHGWQTTLAWDHEPVHKQAKSKFNIDLGRTIYLPTYHLTNNLPQRISFMQKFDLAFFISDGTLPVMAAKHNILHFQVPFHDVKGSNWSNRLKKHTIHDFVANSHFTKDIVDQEYYINCKVIHPPVDVDSFHKGRKQNVILYLARFSNLLQDKGHAQVIDAYKQLHDSGTKNYTLILAGSTEVGTKDYLRDLKMQAKGYPIEIIANPSFSDIQDLYAKAKFFWTTAGLGVSEVEEPEKCEHFGISLVESMAAGCVPLAIRKGGFREIIDHSVNGILYSDIPELLKHTRLLIKDPARAKSLASQAQLRAQDFSKQNFTDQFLVLIS